MASILPERDLTTLFDAYRGETNLGAFLEHALGCAVEWFGAARATLFLKDDLSRGFILAGQAGDTSRVPTHTLLREGEGIAGRALRDGRPLLVDPRDLPDGGSAVVVPLMTPESGPIGVLNVARTIGMPAYDDQDLDVIASIARYIGLAIHNARLFARMNQAVAQSRATSEKLDAIIANLGVGVLVVTPYEEVVGWNPQALQVFGETLQQGVLLRHILKQLPVVLRVTLEQAFYTASEGERISRRAFDSATDLAWSVVASPLPDGGVTLAIQDISEHERANRELARVRRLAEIGQMTAAVAHEIRNPLTGIRSAAQMVQSTSDEACEYGKIIEEEALKLNALCDQFLEFSRPLALNLKEFDPAELAAHVCDLHRPEFIKRSVGLDLLIMRAAPMVKGDPLRLEQILRNLILNGLQACRPGGEVTVVIDGPHLSVQDTGAGIEPHHLEKLFTPFFTTKPSGTGLGLPTVRKIADAHGWDVRVQSTPGVGTTFDLDFGWDQAA